MMVFREYNFEIIRKVQLDNLTLSEYSLNRLLCARENTRGVIPSEVIPPVDIFDYASISDAYCVQSQVYTNGFGYTGYAIGVYGIMGGELVGSTALFLTELRCQWGHWMMPPFSGFFFPYIKTKFDRYIEKALVWWPKPPYEAIEIMFPSIKSRRHLFKRMGFLDNELPEHIRYAMKRLMHKEYIYGKSLADELLKRYPSLSEGEYLRICGK